MGAQKTRDEYELTGAQKTHECNLMSAQKNS